MSPSSILYTTPGVYTHICTPCGLQIWGAALCSGAGVQNPVFVSVGHLISLDTSLRVVTACSRYRIPEPIRQADIRSRQVIREWETRGVVCTSLDSYSVAFMDPKSAGGSTKLVKKM